MNFHLSRLLFGYYFRQYIADYYEKRISIQPFNLGGKTRLQVHGLLKDIHSKETVELLTLSDWSFLLI